MRSGLPGGISFRNPGNPVGHIRCRFNLYRLVGRGSVLPERIRVIALFPFDNRTTRPEIEQRITEEIARELAKRGSYRVVPERSGADALLEGAVTGLRTDPVQFNPEGRATRVETVVTIQAMLRDLSNDEILWNQSGLVFREQYDVPETEAGFFDEETLALEEIARGAIPFLARIGIDVAADDPVLLKTIPYVKPRAATFIEVAEAVDYFFRNVEFDAKGKRKFLAPAYANNLRRLADVLETVEPFAKEPLEHVVKAWLEENELSMKLVAQPARVALTGRTKSPGLFEVMEVLGKEKTLTRLRTGAEIAAAAPVHSD